jgi:excisionase family DNA binding protein
VTITRIPRLLTVTDVAKLAALSPWTVRKEIADGNLTARRVRGAVRILDEEAARWMRESA